MSGYPNMSYCAFENTVRALDQLVAMMGEAVDEARSLSEFTAEMSRDEVNALRKLPYRMNKLLTLINYLEDNEEETV